MRNPIELFQASWGIFSGNPKLYVGIMLVPAIISYLLAISEPNFSTAVINVYEWAIYGVFMLVLFVVNLLMGIALVLALSNQSLSIKAAYSEARKYFWRYILLSILLTVILGLGYLFLIIPGIILTVWFSFSVFVMILENQGPINSLKQSRRYVKGRWWGIFGRLLGLILLTFILSAIVSAVAAAGAAVLPEYILVLVVLAGNLVIAPITMGYLYALYQDVKGTGGQTDLSDPKVAVPSVE